MSYSSTGERRRFPRLKAQREMQLLADVSLLDSHITDMDKAEKLTFFGNTRDISPLGISFIVPCLSLDEQYCQERDRTLSVVLYLPTGGFEVQIAPVRCEPINDGRPADGYLIGAQIKEPDAAKNARLFEYLQAAV